MPLPVHVREYIFDSPSPATQCDISIVKGEYTVPGNLLNDRSCYFSLIILKDTSVSLIYDEERFSFDLEDYREKIQWYGKWWGAVRPKIPFQLEQAEPVLQ